MWVSGRKRREIKNNGNPQSMLCQNVVELKILFLPKNKNMMFGLVFIRASTIGLYKPAGLIAGAKAINTSTLSFKAGCMLKVANACAVP